MIHREGSVVNSQVFMINRVGSVVDSQVIMITRGGQHRGLSDI